jgi:protein-tyrosine phosphatase
MFRLNWIVADKLAGSRYPEPSDLDEIYAQGIRAIVSMEDYEYPEAITSRRMEHLNTGIPDFTAPSLAQLKRIIGFINSMTEKYKPVLVHCYAGIGRTGTVAAAYLINQGNDAESALRHVRARIPGAVQTADQEHILHIYQQDCNCLSFRF